MKVRRDIQEALNASIYMCEYSIFCMYPSIIICVCVLHICLPSFQLATYSCQLIKSFLVFAAIFCLCFPFSSQFFIPLSVSLMSCLMVLLLFYWQVIILHPSSCLLRTWLSNSWGRKTFPNSLIMSSVTLFKENKPTMSTNQHLLVNNS